MLNVISLNIYGGNFLEESLKQLKNAGPDVLCLQEASETHLKRLQEELGLPYMTYAPMWDVQGPNPYGFPIGKMGLAIMSKLPLEKVEKFEYGRPEGKIDGQTMTFNDKKPNNYERLLLSAQVLDEGVPYIFGNTHFTWTPDGQASPQQRLDMEVLLKKVEEFSKMILVGDFNAPKGGEIFAKLTDKLVDNLPHGLVTTIDPENHRKVGLTLIVDGFFTKGQYSIESLEVIPGGSDHLALFAKKLGYYGPSPADLLYQADTQQRFVAPVDKMQHGKEKPPNDLEM